MQHASATYTKREWQTPQLFDLALLGNTLAFDKGLNNAYEIHCTNANTPSYAVYNPTTSGQAHSGFCGR